MADRPIIFSGPMVRALFDGKTQTRRLISTKGQANLFNGEWADSFVLDPGNAGWRAEHVRYAPGDRLYVREAIDKVSIRAAVFYRAEYDAKFTGCSDGLGWRPSIHMPRWASRLTLIVTDVRVQRLQDISEVDAIREGVTLIEETCEDPREAFRDLWDSLYGPGAWHVNPWVVAISFDVHRGNIDEMGAL